VRGTAEGEFNHALRVAVLLVAMMKRPLGVH
jgi:hypothetical protein